MSLIYIPEAIIDPLEYLASYPELMSKIDPSETLIVSGADFDVLVEPLGNEMSKWGRVDEEVTPVLGNLYKQGQVFGALVGKHHVDLEWYPSPAYSNQLSEKMGLKPGEDVFKFVHSPNNELIPLPRFVEHASNFEYPQSTGRSYFSHDRRGDDHSLGVFLMPTYVTHNIVNANSVALSHPKPNKRPWYNTDYFRTRLESAGNIFDGNTSAVSDVVQIIWKNPDHPTAHEKIMKGYSIKYVLPETWGIEDRKTKKPDAKVSFIIDRVAERLEELRPIIESLKVA